MPAPLLSRRQLGLIAAGALGSACGVGRPRLPGAVGPRLPARIVVRHAGRARHLDLEDYVLASALAEVTPVDEPPAAVARIFDVQAVVARSFAASHQGSHRAEGFDLCDTTHCQLYDPARLRTSRFAAAAWAAVRRTAGMVLLHSGRPARALFHADCGGHTAAPERVWGGPPVPYLRPVPDAVPPASHRSWTASVHREHLHVILNQDARSRVGSTLTAIKVHSRDASGRVTEVAVVGDHLRLLRGEDLRAVVTRRLGPHALPSTRFSVRFSGDAWVFDGTGFGHGVGLCQAGAAARAREGKTLEQILAVYYPGARLAG